MHTTVHLAHEPPSSYHTLTAQSAHTRQMSLRDILKTRLRNFVSMLALPTKHISAEPLYLDTAYGHAGSQVHAYIRAWHRQSDSRTRISQPLQPHTPDSSTSWQTASLSFFVN